MTVARGPVPPCDGSVTLPEVIDFHNKHNPDFPIFFFNEDGTEEITEISYFEWGRACDRVAHRMRPGRQGPEGEVVAMVALSDTLLYHAVSVGLMRAGIIVSSHFTAHRRDDNPPPSHSSCPRVTQQLLSLRCSRRQTATDC